MHKWVPKFETEEMTIACKIPENLCPTFIGKLIEVNYKLTVYVKHDAWNEWGSGNGV